MDVNPVTVIVCPFASKIPEVTVVVPVIMIGEAIVTEFEPTPPLLATARLNKVAGRPLPTP